VPFDGVVLHTTFLCARWYRNFADYERRFRWLARVDAPKVALPQDEYDHASVLDEWLAELGTTHVFSNFGAADRSALYPSMSTRAELRQVLTGYIDPAVASRLSRTTVRHDARPYDVVYRAAKLPYWFGSHGQLKHRIGDAAERCANALGLRKDVSTQPSSTIFGDRWLDFVMSGRATVGAESGSSVLDRRGEVRRRIESLLRERPGLTFEQVDERMPPGWDSHRFFALSPRHLEAVITRTCQVLVEGSYSGVLAAGRHYLPVRRDLSNLDDAVRALADAETVETITEQAYDDVYRSGKYTYDVFAREVWDALGEPVERSSAWDAVASAALGGRDHKRRVLERAGAVGARVVPAESSLGRTFDRARTAYRVAREPDNDVTFRSIIRRAAQRRARGLRAR
jgi:hypothetical protein